MAALLLATAASASVIVAQPLRSPWWTYADADATYSAASLSLLFGAPIRFLEHPGLPVEELGTIAFGGEELGQRATGHTDSRHAFVRGQLLHLDRARPVFRGLAAAIYLLGGLLAFVLVTRLYRHWLWGLAASLLWVAAPGLVAMSIQFRPDVALSVALLGFAYLVGRAAETRSPWHFFAAGAALGVATMVKMHAAGAFVALAIVALWRAPHATWRVDARSSAVAFARRRRIRLAVAAAVWVALAVALNTGRQPFTLTAQQVRYGIVLALLACAAFEVARRGWPFAPLAASVAGIIAGLAIPITLDVPDGLQSLVRIRDGLTGRGINQTIEPFSAPLSRLTETPLKQALIVFVIAGVAAVVGVVRRNPLPLAYFAGAAALGVMAEARLAATHYFAPPFILSMFGALWLFRERRALGAVLVWVLVVYAAWPTWHTRRAPAIEAARFAAVVAPAKDYLAAREQQSDIAFVPAYWPFADSLYFDLVQPYTDYVNDYPYRQMPASPAAAAAAEARALRFRYYVNPQITSLAGKQRVEIELGEYTVRPVTGVPLLAQVLHGAGADRPFDHPDAPYDPWTGYFRDARGVYWNRSGQRIVSPARRRLVTGQRVWVDAYGDLWNAAGDHVGNRPDLRTAP